MIKIRKFDDNEPVLSVAFRPVKIQLVKFRADDGDEKKMWSLEGISDRGILKLFLPFTDETQIVGDLVNVDIILRYGIRTSKEYKAVLKLFYIDF